MIESFLVGISCLYTSASLISRIVKMMEGRAEKKVKERLDNELQLDRTKHRRAVQEQDLKRRADQPQLSKRLLNPDAFQQSPWTDKALQDQLKKEIESRGLK